MTLSLNQNVRYLTSGQFYGQEQQSWTQYPQTVQPHFVSNFSHSSSKEHVGPIYLPNHDYSAMMSLPLKQQQQQNEVSKAYQLKQEQLRASEQRHMEEMHYTNCHPHIQHYCAIIDRLHKDDSRYIDFARQVKNNESYFESRNDKRNIAHQMNAQRLCLLGLFIDSSQTYRDRERQRSKKTYSCK
ncbi:hypothetical protein RFI_01925 [Reticulomyxa filosa]|uniref:Uncharacterized protein n=1 Tax=Reticulomyxa filosa TaxID=46433 RepID=X6PAQ6_RETFI|nr:hypothetical protein RFI_01925 [Reticulomyxa filosa]|eukprot:ETO35149.1 hypothetical protein RFI_01925 [Reticulomyxa filosa]